jgi:hypothetical protein
MARYLQVAEELRKEVESFMESFLDVKKPDGPAAVALGHIINLAVRCNPRQAQGTVRKNIVQTAMRNYCRVTMDRLTDPKTGRSYNKISIASKDGGLPVGEQGSDSDDE